MVPADADYHVYCNSPVKGAEKRRFCKAGCIGCRKCEKLFGAKFRVDGFLARVDYDNETVIDRKTVEAIGCPAGCLLPVEERIEAAYQKVKEDKQ